MKIRSIASLVSLVAVMLSAAAMPAAAADGQPVIFGPFVDTYTFIGWDCDGAPIEISGTASNTFTAWFDESGFLSRYLQRTRAPHDTLTNLVTGKSIVVAGEFQEWVVRIPGTDTFQKTITGFRYLVTEPGVGVTIRDVGRIQYGDIEQTIVLWEAGEHDLALDADIPPVFCDRLT